MSSPGRSLLTVRLHEAEWLAPGWWLLVAAPAVVVLGLAGWVVARPLLGRPPLPAGVTVAVGVVAASTGFLGVVGLWRDATSLERAGYIGRPAWPRYALAALAIAAGIAIAWEGGEGSAFATVGEAGAALTEAMAPVGLYYLVRRRRAIRSTDRDQVAEPTR